MFGNLAQSSVERISNMPSNTLWRNGSAALLMIVAVSCPTGTAGAEGPPLYHVRYTVTAAEPFYADIYYRDTDPPNFAEYSHDPYAFSPKIEMDVGPDTPWVMDVMLADPYQWAMVTATSGLSPSSPKFHCELAVEGVVIATDDGPKGALCSRRAW